MRERDWNELSLSAHVGINRPQILAKIEVQTFPTPSSDGPRSTPVRFFSCFLLLYCSSKMETSAAVAGRNRMPLSPISQPQATRQKAPPLPTEVTVNNQQSAFPFTEESDDCKFEVMQVNITIYGLSGIVSRTEEKNRRARHLPRVSKKKKKKK